MTVITMPTAEKKSDNVPLVTNIEIDSTAQVSRPSSTVSHLSIFFRVFPPFRNLPTEP